MQKNLFEIPNAKNSIINNIDSNTIFFEFGKDKFSFNYNYKGKYNK